MRTSVAPVGAGKDPPSEGDFSRRMEESKVVVTSVLMNGFGRLQNDFLLSQLENADVSMMVAVGESLNICQTKRERGAINGLMSIEA